MTLFLNNSCDEGSNEEDFDVGPYSFDDLLDTSKRKETKKKLSRKRKEVLVHIVVSHPNSMKDTTLDHLTRMLRLREREREREKERERESY